MPRFPVSDPFDSGLLDVGDGQRVYYEQVGNPDGIPALIVHGGPGSGCSRGARGNFDPARFRTILFDQRGCGRSLPHVGDPDVDLSTNTTQHLVADMEKLREHVGVEKWLLYGGSWGSTLILAYAQRHPDRVSGVVIPAVTTSDREGIAWLYEGVGRFFPEAAERFRDYIPAEDRGDDVFDLIRAYGNLMAHPDPAIRARTAHEWVTWEDSVISLESNGNPTSYSSRVDDARLAFVRLCTHYFANTAFLEDGELLRNVPMLAGIPAILVHGRQDMGGPVGLAYALAKTWPGAELVIVEQTGHTGSPDFAAAVGDAIERISGRLV